jgi:rhodanese-related sulfurtransferase
MSKTTLVTLAIATLLAGCNAHPDAAKSTEKAAAAPAAIAEQSVAEVAAALREKRVIAVDANGAETRQQYGVVPGALLLSDHKSYALSELPSDKNQPLVFYCGGTKCRASDAAASRAASAGYAKVSVMREGIKGWAGAGQPTTAFSKS